jgi:hypothetical protein
MKSMQPLMTKDKRNNSGKTNHEANTKIMCPAGNPTMTAWVKQCKFAKCRGVHKSLGVGVQKETAKGYYQSIMLFCEEY